MRIIAIDPGFAASGEGCACAMTLDGTLVAAWYERPESPRVRFAADEVVWECPQVDSRTRVSVPAIVTLAATGGLLAGLYAGASQASVVAVSPAQWKGSTPKPVHHRRMWSRLSVAERAVLGGDATETAINDACRRGALNRWGRSGASYYRGCTMHNLLDATGIALWRCGRSS